MRLTAVLLALALATPAAAFTAQNGLIVQPDGPDRFNVPYLGRSGPADFWCAAGDYAVRKLRLLPNQRIYRLSEPPRRSGEGISFSVRADGAASTTGLLVLGARGGGLSVGMAQSLCENDRRRR